MATFTSVLLSGSSNGKLISSTQIASPGVTLHVPSTLGSHDEVYLWACNNSTHDRLLTVEWGSTIVANNVTFTVPSTGQGMYAIIPGLRITGSTNTVSAFAASSSSPGLMVLGGYANRIST